MTVKATKIPASLIIAEEVSEPVCKGYYDEASKTWSNRDFELAATKKHNEAM
jgi:hypothetical protein